MDVAPTDAFADDATLRRALQAREKFASAALSVSARFWFLAVVAGQLVFAIYIAVFYGRAASHGTLGDRATFLAHGYIPGDIAGNAAAASHIVVAIVVSLGGAMQLLPILRKRAPAIHRWNGRLYALAAVIGAASGFYMTWFRGAVGDLSQHVGGSIDAALIVLCAALAVRYAVARNLVEHRRWALRLFVVVGGVWFFRVGLMLWLIVNRGPVGFDPATFTGPFLTFLTFAEYAIPLAVLELYLHAEARGNAFGRISVAAGVIVLTLAMSIGVAGAIAEMWVPHIVG